MLIFYHLLPHCYRRRLVAVVIVGVLASATRRQSRSRQSLVIVTVLLFSSEAASRIYMRSLVYIRLTMHATTTKPQHQVQNSPAAL